MQNGGFQSQVQPSLPDGGDITHINFWLYHRVSQN